MNRVEFTNKLAALIGLMVNEGERPILDYVKRGVETQNRMFEEGRSKCDGIKVVSKHQSGKAADIYFADEMNTHLVEPKKGYEHWHRIWREMGGGEMIPWDRGHFE